jgi:hypothetical protein
LKQVLFTAEAQSPQNGAESASPSTDRMGTVGGTCSNQHPFEWLCAPRRPLRLCGDIVPQVPPALVLLIAAAACAPDEPDPCAHEPALTYENFGQSFLGRYCNGCHGSTIPDSLRNDAPGQVDLDHYEGVLRWAYEIEEQAAVEEPTMPPGGGTTPLERQLLREWLTCEVFPDYWAYDPEIDL